MKESISDAKGNASTKEVERFCLVIDCFVPHDFSASYNNLIDMQCYVIQAKKIKEAEAIRIFCKVVQIVERLHKVINSCYYGKNRDKCFLYEYDKFYVFPTGSKTLYTEI